MGAIRLGQLPGTREMTPFPDAASRAEWVDERAAILEHEAGYDRETAERLAEQIARTWEAAHDDR